MKIIFFIVLLKLINADENNDNQFIETLPADVKKTLLDKISRRILEEVPEVDTEDTATNGEIIDAKLEEQSEFVKKILREEIDSLKARKKNDDDKLEVPDVNNNGTVARTNSKLEHVDLTLRSKSKRAAVDEKFNTTQETNKGIVDKEEKVTTKVNMERKDNINENITPNIQGHDNKNNGSETTFLNEASALKDVASKQEKKIYTPRNENEKVEVNIQRQDDRNEDREITFEENSLKSVTLKNENENATENIQRQDDRNDNASIIFPSKEISVKVVPLKQDNKNNLSPSGVTLSNVKKKLLRHKDDRSVSHLVTGRKNKTKDIPQTESTTIKKLSEKIVSITKKAKKDVKNNSEKQKSGPTIDTNQKLEKQRNILKTLSERNGQLFSNDTSNEYLENNSPTETIITKDSTKVDIVQKIEGSTKRKGFNTAKPGLKNDNVFAGVPTRTTSAPYHATAFTKTMNSETIAIEKKSSKTPDIGSNRNSTANMKDRTEVKKPCNKTKTLNGTKSDCNTKTNVTAEDVNIPTKVIPSPMRSFPTDVKKPCNKTKTLNGTKTDCDTKSNVTTEENTIPVQVIISPMRGSVKSTSRQAPAEHFGSLRNRKEYQVFETDENKSPFVQTKDKDDVEQPHYFPVYNYEPRNVHYNAENRFGPNIESERTNLRDNVKGQRKRSSAEHFGDLQVARGYQVFEADSNTQLVQENRNDNVEEPQYYPVYNYDPKNVYYNAFNRLGPNDDDAEDTDGDRNAEIEIGSTVMDGQKMLQQPKEILVSKYQRKRQTETPNKKKKTHENYVLPPKKYPDLKSNLQAIRYVLNRDQDFGYIAVKHQRDREKRNKVGLRGDTENAIWENTYETDSEYVDDLNEDSSDDEDVNSTNEISSLIDFLINVRDKKQQKKKTLEAERSLNGENYVFKDLHYPLQNSHKVLENQMEKSRLLASIEDLKKDKFKPSEDGGERKWENTPKNFEIEKERNGEYTSEVLEDNLLPFRVKENTHSYKVDTIEKIINITPEIDVFTQLNRLVKNKVPISRSNDHDDDDDLDMHLNILKDLVQLDSSGLEMYDWLGTTVDIQAALTKLIDLVNRRNTFSFIHPADLQLLKYVEAIHKNAQKILLQRENDEIPLPKAVYNNVQLNKRLPKVKKKIPNPLITINKLYKVRSSDNLEGFLLDLKNGLEDFHTVIKEISKITKFNHQRWYKNIKELYLANEGRKEYLEVLLHLFSTRLFGLIEESLKNGAEDNYIAYMRKNRAEVDTTEAEVIFILRILRALKN